MIFIMIYMRIILQLYLLQANSTKVQSHNQLFEYKILIPTSNYWSLKGLTIPSILSTING